MAEDINVEELLEAPFREKQVLSFLFPSAITSFLYEFFLKKMNKNLYIYKNPPKIITTGASDRRTIERRRKSINRRKG